MITVHLKVYKIPCAVSGRKYKSIADSALFNLVQTLG
jgi:hypothetical protein